MGNAVLIVLVFAGLVLGAGVVAGALALRKAYVRSRLLVLVAKTEAVTAAARAFADVLERLAGAEDAAIAGFAADPETSDRKALVEVATRAQILSQELDLMPVPRELVPVAELLADAALLIAREAGRFHDGVTGAAALDALAATDLGMVLAYVGAARARLHEACERAGVEDTAVYGGGLYL